MDIRLDSRMPRRSVELLRLLRHVYNNEPQGSWRRVFIEEIIHCITTSWPNVRTAEEHCIECSTCKRVVDVKRYHEIAMSVYKQCIIMPDWAGIEEDRDLAELVDDAMRNEAATGLLCGAQGMLNEIILMGHALTKHCQQAQDFLDNSIS